MTLLYVVQGPSTMNTLLATSAGLSRHFNENPTVSLNVCSCSLCLQQRPCNYPL